VDVFDTTGAVTGLDELTLFLIFGLQTDPALYTIGLIYVL